MGDPKRMREVAAELHALADLLDGASRALEERAGLQETESSANLRDVTPAELEHRGRQIAKGWAKKSKDRLWKAITQSKWGSQERYARERLGKSPASLSSYRAKGGTPCPRTVADRVRADFGIGDDYWPNGVAD